MAGKEDLRISTNGYLRRVGYKGIISRTQAPNDIKSFPQDYFYYTGYNKFYGPIPMMNMIQIPDLNNLNIENISAYLRIEEKENAYSAISRMPASLVKLFNINGNIFNINDYKEIFQEKERTPSGAFSGNWVNHEIRYYQSSSINSFKLLTPESMDFWIDFLDNPVSESGKLGVKNISQRIDVENNGEKVNAIYYRDALMLQFGIGEYDSTDIDAKIKNAPTEEEKKRYEVQKNKEKAERDAELTVQTRLLSYLSKNYSWYVLDDDKYNNYFINKKTGISCKEVLDKKLYSSLNLLNSISVSTIPVYHLQPNDVINLNDDESMIHGNYIINSISIPLTYNGISNISASKQIEKLY